MARAEIESGVAALEAEVNRLKSRLGAAAASKGDWLDEITGVFASDAIHEEAMKLGHEYREAQRPRAPAKPKGNTSTVCRGSGLRIGRHNGDAAKYPEKPSVLSKHEWLREYDNGTLQERFRPDVPARQRV
jgi:hypothetical protein